MLAPVTEQENESARGLWDVNDGRVTCFEQLADTKLIAEAMR